MYVCAYRPPMAATSPPKTMNIGVNNTTEKNLMTIVEDIVRIVREKLAILVSTVVQQRESEM